MLRSNLTFKCGLTSLVVRIQCRFLSTSTCIYANANGPRDAASRKIGHIALPTKYNYQATSVGR